jgi:NDP-sugar pyrophosphorylase family protein
VPSDLGRDLLPDLIASRRTILGYRMGEGERLYWIDTPEDLAAARAEFARTGSHV